MTIFDRCVRRLTLAFCRYLARDQLRALNAQRKRF